MPSWTRDVPPRLTAPQLFWWGLGLLVGTLVASQVLQRLINAWTWGVPDLVVWGYSVLSFLQLVGAGLFAASFVLRALEPAAAPPPPPPVGAVDPAEGPAAVS